MVLNGGHKLESTSVYIGKQSACVTVIVLTTHTWLLQQQHHWQDTHTHQLIIMI